MVNFELVSIIIPVYNAEKYLRRCIESIICQSYYNLEILLINDGSKDKSSSICDEYAAKDNRIYVIHQKNKGVAFARNTGILNARGKYISFVDSDDWLEKDAIMNLYNGYIKSKAELIVSKRIVSNEDEQERGQQGQCFKVNEVDKWYCNYLYPYLYSVWGKLYIADIIKKNNILFHVDIPWGEDTIYVIDYINSISKVNIIQEQVYNYYVAEETASHKYYQHMCQYSISILDAYNKMSVRHSKYPVNSNNNWLMSVLFSKCYYNLRNIPQNKSKKKTIMYIYQTFQNYCRQNQLKWDPAVVNRMGAFLLNHKMIYIYMLLKEFGYYMNSTIMYIKSFFECDYE